MLTALLLALPLFAASYALGGLAPGDALGVAALIGVGLLHAATVGLFCSALCQTPTGALLLTYAVLVGMYAGPPALLDLAGQLAGHPRWSWGLGDAAFGMSPLAQLTRLGSGRPIPWLALLAPVLVFAALARVVVLRCAAVRSRSLLRRLTLAVDRWMHALNRHAGGVEWRWGGEALPDDAPVAWRATARGALGRPHHLLRALLVVMLPTVAVCAVQTSYPDPAEGLAMALVGVWLLAAAGLGSLAASAISAERTRRTLDLLLVTPLPGAQLVREAMQGPRRADGLVWAPLLLLLATWAFCEVGLQGADLYPTTLGLALSLVVTALLLALIRWIGMAYGLMLRTRGQAVLAMLVTLGVWCALPPIVAGLLAAGPEDSLVRFIACLSPATATSMLTSGRPDALWPVGLQVVTFSALLYAVRRDALDCADRRLGRPA